MYIVIENLRGGGYKHLFACLILPLLLLSFSLLSFASSSDPQCAFAAETQSNVHDFSYTGSVQTFTAIIFGAI